MKFAKDGAPEITANIHMLRNRFFCDPEITFRISQYNSEECLPKRSDFKFAYT